jgi:DnaJ-class molecular chaperone
MNAYDLLGLQRDADLDAIKSAYRALAKELHPDVNAGDENAADRFKEITAAYNMLADKRKRAEYDGNRMGRDENASGAKPWEEDGAWYDFEIDETSGERIMDLFGDIAGTRLGRVKGAAATTLYMKGQDVAVPLKITYSEARNGVCKLVTTMTGLTVAVTVPANAVHGQVVSLPGFGIEGFGGAQHGDLNVLLELVPDPAIGAKP